MEPQALSKRTILALLLVGLLTPLALIFYDDGEISILAALWLFVYFPYDSHTTFEWIIQSSSTVVMWIWRFVFLFIFIQFYKRKMSYRQLKYGAATSQCPWILANIGIFLNWLIGGTLGYFMIPIPFLVFVALLVLRVKPRSEPPEDWLDEKDSSWGPTINIDDDKTTDS